MSANPLAPDWLVEPSDANALDAGRLVAARRARRVRRARDRGRRRPRAARRVRHAALRRRRGRRPRARGRHPRRLRVARSARVGADAHVYYAGKAFLSIEVARWMIEAGLNIDVCSGGELAVALAADVDPRATRASTATTRASPRSTARSRPASARSLSTASSRSTVSPTPRRATGACSRCACASTAACTPRPTSTSRPPARTRSSASRSPTPPTPSPPSAPSPSLRFLGLHSHIGSQIFESDGFAEAARRLLDAARASCSRAATGARAQPRRRLRHRLHERRRGRCRSTTIARRARRRRRGGVRARSASRSPSSRSSRGAPSSARRASPSTRSARSRTCVVDESAAIRALRQRRRRHERQHPPRALRADYSVRIANRVSDADPALVRVAGKHCEIGRHRRARRLPAGRRRAPATCSPCPRRAPTAGRWRATTTTSAARPSSPCATGTARVLVRRETEDDLLAATPATPVAEESEPPHTVGHR